MGLAKSHARAARERRRECEGRHTLRACKQANTTKWLLPFHVAIAVVVIRLLH